MGRKQPASDPNMTQADIATTAAEICRRLTNHRQEQQPADYEAVLSLLFKLNRDETAELNRYFSKNTAYPSLQQAFASSFADEQNQATLNACLERTAREQRLLDIAMHALSTMALNPEAGKLELFKLFASMSQSDFVLLDEEFAKTHGDYSFDSRLEEIAQDAQNENPDYASAALDALAVITIMRCGAENFSPENRLELAATATRISDIELLGIALGGSGAAAVEARVCISVQPSLYRSNNQSLPG